MNSLEQAIEWIAATHARPTEKKIGRNEPCPCGSGRKYKKCCARTRKAPTAQRPLDLQSVLPDLDSIPRIRADTQQLEHLFQTEPVFQEYAPGVQYIVDFITAEEARTGKLIDALDIDVLEDTADRFIEQHLTSDDSEWLRQVLLDALKKHPDDIASIRAILFALFVLEAAPLHVDHHPLSVLVFNHVRSQAYSETLDIVRRKSLKPSQQHDDPFDEAQALLESLDPKTLSTLKHLSERVSRVAEEAMFEGSFPVYLGLPSSLPALADTLMRGESLTPGELETYAEVLDANDAALFLELARRWLDDETARNPGPPNALQSAVHLIVLEVQQTGRLGSWALYLLINALQVGSISDWERQHTRLILESGLWDVEGLDRLADAYEAQGHAALAQRLRELLPSLRGKHARHQAS